MVFTYEFDNTILIKATGSGEAIIPEKCIIIEPNLFYECSGLTSVIFNVKMHLINVGI